MVEPSSCGREEHTRQASASTGSDSRPNHFRVQTVELHTQPHRVHGAATLPVSTSKYSTFRLPHTLHCALSSFHYFAVFIIRARRPRVLNPTQADNMQNYSQPGYERPGSTMSFTGQPPPVPQYQQQQWGQPPPPLSQQQQQQQQQQQTPAASGYNPGTYGAMPGGYTQGSQVRNKIF